MCAQYSYICLTGDMNARTSTLCDFITADSFIADLMDFDQDTLMYYNQAEQLKTLHIKQHRISCDKKTNNNGHKLIETCINDNLFILNGRYGQDSTEGKFTFRDQSIIDYTICSFSCLKLLLDFEVIETDNLLSDGHALLSWSMSAAQTDPGTCNLSQNEQNNYKKWDQKHRDDFIKNISLEDINNLYLNIEPTEISINEVTFKIAEVLIQSAKTSFQNKKVAN